MILLSLASKQIWPHILVVAQMRPEQVVLLHSDDMVESQGPAQRLKRFFDKSGLVPKGGTRLALVPHQDFAGMEEALDGVQLRAQLPLGQCCLNFTGGNKLMATAGFRWAAKRSVPSFYLERGNRLTWFEPRDAGDMRTREELLNGHLADALDPVELLRCHLTTAEIERPGQNLTLAGASTAMKEEEFMRKLDAGTLPRQGLEVQGVAGWEVQKGDELEYRSAAVLLKLGVQRVQRSLRLKVKAAAQTGTRNPHTEIDLLFTWAGRLWLVDCKDRIPAENLADNLRRMLPPRTSDAVELFDRIRNELSISQTKVMKEDLLAIREIGGLLGQVLCVRNAELPDEVAQYAQLNQIEVVQKANLAAGFRKLLFPQHPPGPKKMMTMGFLELKDKIEAQVGGSRA